MLSLLRACYVSLSLGVNGVFLFPVPANQILLPWNGGQCSFKILADKFNWLKRGTNDLEANVLQEEISAVVEADS